MNKKEIKKLFSEKTELNKFLKKLENLELSLRSYCHNSKKNKEFTIEDLFFLKGCPDGPTCGVKLKNRLDLDTSIAWDIAEKVSNIIFYLPKTNNVSLLDRRYSSKIIIKEIRDSFQLIIENLNYFIEFTHDIVTLVGYHEEKYPDLFDLCALASDEFEAIYPYFSKKLETVQKILDKE